MKQLLAIILATFTFTAMANDAPAKSEPTTTKNGVKLAKKKDHSKDKKATPSKSQKAPAKKASNKSK